MVEKIVTDWYSLYSTPNVFNEMKNCVIYISEYNLERFKNQINKLVADKYTDEMEKRVLLKELTPIINFIKHHNLQLKEHCMQTEELEFIKENNSSIVVVKETKDIRTMKESLFNKNINKEENDTIYIAISEEAELFTIKNTTIEILKENKIPVFCVDIKKIFQK